MMFQDWEPLVKAASGDVRRLDHVVRFSSVPVTYKESVSSHSYWVSLYAIMIHNEISKDKLLGYYILIYALTHDVAESRMGDYVRTAKYSSESLKDEIDKTEKKIIEQFRPILKDLIKEANNLTIDSGTYVKSVVKAADFMDLFQFMRREALKSNLEIYPYFYRMVRDLSMMSNKTYPKPFDGQSYYKSLEKNARRIGALCFMAHDECELNEIVEASVD